MGESDPRAVVEAAFQRLNEHDIDGYFALCADDFVYSVGPSVVRGKPAARAVDEPAYTALPDHWRRIDKILASRDTVAVWLTFGGTRSADGVAREVDVCDIFEVRDGLIQSLACYADWNQLIS
jgi:ketosteroid isomerase-like protein